MNRWLTIVTMLLGTLLARAQGSYDVDWSEMGNDSVMPCWSTSIDLGLADGGDYVARIEYPELVAVEADAPYYSSLLTSEVGEWPEVHTYVGIASKRARLDVSFTPVLYRDGKYWRIQSFDLKVDRLSSPASSVSRHQVAGARRGAEHSKLASGRWVKISVTEDGLYQLTAKRLAAMGFKDPAKVRIFGYGGHLLPEYGLASLPDDLPEVPAWHDDDRVVFFGNGTISWKQKGNGTWTHTQNHFANAGYYFLTDNDSIPADPSCVAPDMAFLLPEAKFYGHALYEKEGVALHPSGRKLFDSYNYAEGAEKTYTLDLPGLREGEKGYITVSFAHSIESTTSVQVSANGSPLGSFTVPANSSYSDASLAESTFETAALTASTRLTLRHERPVGTTGRLDFISISYPIDPQAWADNYLKAIREPDDWKAIEPQDLHGMAAADFFIVVPSSGALLPQAERLAEAHRTRDGLKVTVVRAEQIYNEFSSGTPDATAIRRFLKLFYDRAANEQELPRYLLLFGDGAWDNRMLSDNWKGCSPDDYLPCFESENSFSTTRSYVMEDYYGLLDDSEGMDLQRDKPDVGVGRFPVTTPQQAREAVDKAIAYMDNTVAGSWKNTIIMMGDDGDNNQHMEDAEFVARMLEDTYPKYMLKRIYWDTFPMEVTATGNSYPAVHSRILELLGEGALMVNYSGHGSADVLSHELVVSKADMEALTSPRLPLWVTASCDISPFDNTATSFGEYAFLNPKGGAIALFTTTRTVFSSYNRRINYLFSKYVLARDAKGQRLRLGDAVREAKCEIISTPNASMQDFSENKLHYVLLGDPALRIGNADYDVAIDRLNGKVVDSDEELLLNAGEKVTVSGHICTPQGVAADDFEGMVCATVLDNRETVVGRNNNGSASSPFSYTERSKVLFSGSDSVRGGRFDFVFRVPMDINYSGESGLLNVYAINNAKDVEAQGTTDAFLLGGTEESLRNDSLGPTIALYLNTPSFVPGDQVNETPLLVATLEDADGINAVGNAIGHDLVAVIDGEASLTYKLNNYYTSAFGDYTRGTLAYSLPPLAAGKHTLMLRAWDLMNNSSTAIVDFEVVEGLTPSLTDVMVTDSPARTETSFVITHDRPESVVTFRLEVFDFSGRMLWQKEETTATSSNTYTTSWNLCNSAGTPLQDGVYLYRVTATSTSGSSTSQSRKLVVKR